MLILFRTFITPRDFSWSGDEAITYISQQTGMSPREATTQVNRIITIPAQSLVDKIGHMKIHQLRQRAETILGKICFFVRCPNLL